VIIVSREKDGRVYIDCLPVTPLHIPNSRKLTFIFVWCSVAPCSNLICFCASESRFRAAEEWLTFTFRQCSLSSLCPSLQVSFPADFYFLRHSKESVLVTSRTVDRGVAGLLTVSVSAFCASGLQPLDIACCKEVRSHRPCAKQCRKVRIPPILALVCFHISKMPYFQLAV
jgi:hypothetical protein